MLHIRSIEMVQFIAFLTIKSGEFIIDISYINIHILTYVQMTNQTKPNPTNPINKAKNTNGNEKFKRHRFLPFLVFKLQTFYKHQ